MSLRTVRDALGNQITQAIPELTYTPALTGNTPMPALIVAVPFEELDYLGTFGRAGQWGMIPFRVGVALNPTLLVEAVDAATAFAEASGPQSIWAAVMDDRSLGGAIGDNACAMTRGAGLSYEDSPNGPAHLLVSFIVNVTMPKES